MYTLEYCFKIKYKNGNVLFENYLFKNDKDAIEKAKEWKNSEIEFIEITSKYVEWHFIKAV